MNRSRIFLAALALACGSAFAGTVEVRYIDPDNFSDLATNRWQERDTMEALTRYLQQLGQQLPADQVLRVDVLDVDLAGTWRETPRGRIRVERNRADPPKIHVRWALESGGQVLRSGEDRLTDLDYTHHLATYRSSTPYYYEKLVLHDWFRRNFAPELQAYVR
jgi:hypothetical protein